MNFASSPPPALIQLGTRRSNFLADAFRSGFLHALGYLMLMTNAGHAQTDYSELFTKTSPRVVTLRLFDSEGTVRGQGSGFLADRENVLITCYHVVENARIIQIQLANDKFAYATGIWGSDPGMDLAAVRIEALDSEPLELAAIDPVPGKPIVAIGSPLGNSNTISPGIISGLREEGRIQFTNPISGGSSGGPLLDLEGRVVGIVSATETVGQNINFGIPASAIRKLLKQIDPKKPLATFEPVPKDIREKIEGGQATRASLMRDLSPEDVKALDAMIGDAIVAGVAVYNAGFATGCYRIYEGVAYKILDRLGERNELLRSTLEKALESAEKAPSADSKAWHMRSALDRLLGVPTQTR